jgi:hypothetical protein
VPASENRSYTDEEHCTDANTEIVLAFPLTEDSIPVVENQDVFAFLPKRPMGFKVSFLSLTVHFSREKVVNHKIYSLSCIQTL